MLPKNLAKAFVGAYSTLFVLWIIVMASLALLRSPNHAMAWSNIFIPSLLFVVLIISAFFAGERLGRRCHDSGRVPLLGVLLSALQVSSALGLMLVLILGIGLINHAVPPGAAFVGPFVAFTITFATSFVAHWVITVLVFKASAVDA